jgi:fibronectin type 3 domain-containing protein
MKRGLALSLILSALFAVSFSYTGCAEKGFSRGEPGTINLAWNPNKEPDLKGYKVYYGTSSRRYGPGIDVGKVTSYSLTGLVTGTRYYISITAYNTKGRESSFSNEVIGFAKQVLGSP